MKKREIRRHERGDSEASQLRPSLGVRMDESVLDTPCLGDEPDKDFPRGRTSAEGLKKER